MNIEDLYPFNPNAQLAELDGGEYYILESEVLENDKKTSDRILYIESNTEAPFVEIRDHVPYIKKDDVMLKDLM